MRLTKNFIENWEKDVGMVPSLHTVLEILKQSAEIQTGQQFIYPGFTIKTLSIYWNVDKDLLLTVDHYTDSVVSVYSKENVPRLKAPIIGGRRFDK